MKHQTIIWILIPITLFLVFVLIFYLYKTSTKKKRLMSIKTLEKETRKGRLSKADMILSRVKIIANANNKYLSLFSNLSNLHDQIEIEIKTIGQNIARLSTNRNKYRKKAFNYEVANIKSKISRLKKIDYEFNINAQKVMQQDEFMRSELAFYANNLRQVIAVYRQKRILLNKISDKIDDLSLKIKKNEKEFNGQLELANNHEANKILSKYSKYVVLFSNIINEGPSIQSFLYITIPRLIKILVKNYKAKKEKINGNLEHLDFKKTILEIAKKYKIAKASYLRLDLEKAKKEIKNILKAIKILEKLINFEIKSRNLFMASYQSVISETKEVLKHYISLRKKIKMLLGKGTQISAELMENYIVIKERVNELDDYAIEFRNVLKNTTLAYSSKITRMKILLQKNNELLEMINATLNIIWSLNINNLIVKNKFKKADSALNQLIANTKRYKIILTNEEQKNFKELSQDISLIASKMVLENITYEIVKKVDKIVEKTTAYYKVVGGKIQIVKIIKNLITDLSPKRALDRKLNQQLLMVERQYLSGKYIGSLNTIITYLEEEKI